MKETTKTMVIEKIKECAIDMEAAEYPGIYEEFIVFLHKIIKEEEEEEKSVEDRIDEESASSH